MVGLAAAARMSEEARMRAIAAEEVEIRNKLARLEEHAAAVAAPADDTTLELRSVGADLLWQGWVNRARRDLQTDLARVLARKGEEARYLQRAHGRSEAILSLRDAAAKAERFQAEKHRLQHEQGLFLLRSAAGRLPR